MPKSLTAIVLALAPFAAAQCPNPTLFFSQFQEASSGNNKYYQIYNPTDATIDLANGYTLASCGNGCGTDGVFEFTQSFASGATIAAGGTYTVCNSYRPPDPNQRADTLFAPLFVS